MNPLYIRNSLKVPLKKLDSQNLDLDGPRSACLTLRGLFLRSHDCESLEEIIKSVPFKLLDLGASHTDDDVLLDIFLLTDTM